MPKPDRPTTDLTPPEPPTDVPVPVARAPELEAAGVARRAPFLAEGAAAVVVGDQRDGVREIWLAGRRAAQGPELPGAVGVRYVLHPGAWRRELVAGGASLTEAAAVAPTLPLLVFRWDAAVAVHHEVRLTLLPDLASAHLHLRGAVASRVAPAAPSQDASFQVVAAWTGEGAPSWRAAGDDVVAALQGRSATLVLAAGTERQVTAALRAARHIDVHAQRAAGAVPDALALSARGPEADAVSWGVRRVSDALARTAKAGAARTPAPPADASGVPEALFWTLQGAAAAGLGRDAAACLGAWTEGGRWTWPAALLAAELALTTGGAGGALDAAQWARQEVERPGPPGPLRELAVLALERLADALRYAAPEDFLGALRRGADRLRSAARTLPLAGGAQPEGASSALQDDPRARFVRLLAAVGVPPGHGGLPAAARRGDPAALRRAWLDSVAGAERDGPAGPWTWDEAAAAAADAAPGAGLALTLFLRGVLGYEPDAPSGRAVLAPWLSPDMPEFDVRGLPLGDGAIHARYRRTKGTHRLEVEPARGAVPPLLVLQPLVSGPVAAARVDGEAATLDRTFSGAVGSVRLQLPLDAARTLEVDVDQSAR